MFTENALSMLIGSFIIILALHLLLQGTDYRKKIFLNNSNNIKSQKTNKENFEISENSNYTLSSWNPIKDENIKTNQCHAPIVVAANRFIDNKNDPNFQSNVLNVNRFYTKNIQDEPNPNELKDDPNDQDNRRKINQYNDLPTTWKYKNELAMNGGTLFDNVRGYDNLIDQTQKAICENKTITCNPSFGSKRGALLNDDLRMGLGTTNSERRMVT